MSNKSIHYEPNETSLKSQHQHCLMDSFFKAGKSNIFEFKF